MEIIILVNLPMEFEMEKEHTINFSKRIMKENGETTLKQDMGYVNFMMEVYLKLVNRNMRVNGKKIKCMVKGFIHGKAENMLVYIIRD
jgi:hypothetical protein